LRNSPPGQGEEDLARDVSVGFFAAVLKRWVHGERSGVFTAGRWDSAAAFQRIGNYGRETGIFGFLLTPLLEI